MNTFLEIKINTWVSGGCLLIDYWGIDKRHLVHPDDQYLIKNNNSLGLLKCIDYKDGYYYFIGKSFTIRALKDAIFRIEETPAFNFGQRVVDMTKEGKIEGSIYDIMWHQNNNEYMYFINVNGKQKSRRYVKEELKAIEDD